MSIRLINYEVTNAVKENNRFSREKVLIMSVIKYPEIGSIMESKDIFVNPAERLLLILHLIQSITARKMLIKRYNKTS